MEILPKDTSLTLDLEIAHGTLLKPLAKVTKL